MYISMTGFSRTQLQRPWGTLSLELSSVNHRYQEITVKLPRDFAGWEPWFHQKLRAAFRRGKVQARIEVFWAQDFKKAQLNREIFDSYCKELLALREELGQESELQLERIVTLPGVLELPTVGDDDDTYRLEETFSELLENGVKAWQEMRALEGGHLRGEILLHLANIETLAAKIAERWQTARDDAFNAVRARISETLEKLGGALEESRFLQEITIMADKWDVAEELARLKSHIEKFRLTGDENLSSGRKLDFLTQEINREINTLDSKVADSEIRWLAVEAKSELEMVREQIQNLE